jgi:hypothetical protein
VKRVGGVAISAKQGHGNIILLVKLLDREPRLEHVYSLPAFSHESCNSWFIPVEFS